MATDCIPQLRFKFDKLVVARFDAEHVSSDGGMVLLEAVDQQLGVTEAVASCDALSDSSPDGSALPDGTLWRDAPVVRKESGHCERSQDVPLRLRERGLR